MNCLAANTSYECSSATVIFINSDEKLILSKNLKECLVSGEYNLYAGGALVPSTESLTVLSDCQPIKILNVTSDIYIMTIDEKVLAIENSYGDDTQYLNYIKRITSLTNISDMYISNKELVVITRDNTLHHTNINIPVDAFDTLNFENPIKLLRISDNLIVVLFEDASVFICTIFSKTKIEKRFPGKVVIDIHITDRYIMYLFNDLQVFVEGSTIGYSTEQYEVTSKVIHRSTTDYCVSVSIEDAVDAINNLYTISPFGGFSNSGSIIPILEDTYCLNDEDMIFHIKSSQYLQHLQHLPYLDSEVCTQILALLTSLNYKFLICSANVLIFVMIDNSLKFYESSVDFFDYYEVDGSELFDVEDLGNKVFEDAGGSFI